MFLVNRRFFLNQSSFTGCYNKGIYLVLTKYVLRTCLNNVFLFQYTDLDVLKVKQKEISKKVMIIFFHASYYDKIFQYYWNTGRHFVTFITEYHLLYPLYGSFTSCTKLFSNNHNNDKDADMHNSCSFRIHKFDYSSKISSRLNYFFIFSTSKNYRTCQTVGINYRLGNGMVNHRTIITLQDKCRLNKQPVTLVSRV